MKRVEGAQHAIAGQSAWSRAILLFLAATAVSVVVFVDAWRTLLDTWISIDTYNYGLFVPLISFALLMNMRRQIAALDPVASAWGIAAAAGVTLLWMVGDLAGVLSLKQLAALAFIPSAALALFGLDVMRLAAFPFLYVLLALPMGEFLIPALITWTADFAVMALEWFAIPVYREGPYIRIPAGAFHVVKACSGIRYLLTAFVLGALFAYLSFRSPWRRAGFMVLCIVAPIVANWVRATGIILIGHLSDMRLAAGVDHFIYGWVFFGLVMLIIFLIGNRFRDGRGDRPGNVAGSTADGSASRVPVLVAFAAVVLTAPAGIVASGLIADRGDGSGPRREQLLLPGSGPSWRRDDAIPGEWEPVFLGARLIRRADFSSPSRGDVSVLAVYYDSQEEGRELVNARNSLFEPITWWKRFEKPKVVTDDDSGLYQGVRETSINDGERNRLLWSWYSIGGEEVSGTLRAKLVTLRAAVLGEGSDAFLIAIAADYGDDIETARQALGAFLSDNHADLRRCLALEQGDGCE